MAEYIDKEELFSQCEWMYDPKAECEADASRYVIKMDIIQLMHPSDVIEREKINEAKKIAEETISTCFKLGFNERADGMREILEVFERVTGE